MEDRDELRKLTREDNCVVVLAVLESGPAAGGPIASVCPRDQFVKIIRDTAAMRRMQQTDVIKSIKNTIKQVIPNIPKGEIERSQIMEDFCQDLVLLLASKLATRSGDDFLKGTGLMSLHLWIDEDETLPWDKRGMLDPDLIEELKLDTRPTIIG